MPKKKFARRLERRLVPQKRRSLSLRRGKPSRTHQLKDGPISTLAQFVAEVCDLHKAWRSKEPKTPLWFRGQGDADRPLRPKFYRDSKDGDLDEDELRYDFERRAVQFPLARTPASDWEWYFLMQHYRMPTRLLDWTEGALIALHFALSTNKGTDAAVWALDPWWLNEHVLRRNGTLTQLRTRKQRERVLELLPDPKDDRTRWIRRYLPRSYSSAGLPKLPAALQPPHIDRRIAAQFSGFTIHGRARAGLEQLIPQSPRRRLRMLRISGSHVEDMRKHLTVAGVVETTAFADLEGLGRELTYLFTEKPIDT